MICLLCRAVGIQLLHLGSKVQWACGLVGTCICSSLTWVYSPLPPSPPKCLCPSGGGEVTPISPNHILLRRVGSRTCLSTLWVWQPTPHRRASASRRHNVEPRRVARRRRRRRRLSGKMSRVVRQGGDLTSAVTGALHGIRECVLLRGRCRACVAVWPPNAKQRSELVWGGVAWSGLVWRAFRPCPLSLTRSVSSLVPSPCVWSEAASPVASR